MVVLAWAGSFSCFYIFNELADCGRSDGVFKQLQRRLSITTSGPVSPIFCWIFGLFTHLFFDSSSSSRNNTKFFNMIKSLTHLLEKNCTVVSLNLFLHWVLYIAVVFLPKFSSIFKISLRNSLIKVIFFLQKPGFETGKTAIKDSVSLKWSVYNNTTHDWQQSTSERLFQITAQFHEDRLRCFRMFLRGKWTDPSSGACKSICVLHNDL